MAAMLPPPLRGNASFIASLLAPTALLQIWHKKRNHEQCIFSTHLALSHQKPQHKATTMDSPVAHKGGRWSFSAQGALLLFFFAAFPSIGLCVSAVVRKRRIQQAKEAAVPNVITKEESASGWREIKKAVIGSQVVGPERRTWQETEVRLAVAEPAAAKGRWEEQGGVMYVAPLWQGGILMGEKCEMPRFSGLILYDERGRPLMSSNNSNRSTVQQVSESFGSDVETESKRTVGVIRIG